MSEHENIDENAPQAPQRIKYSVRRISKKQEWKRKWHRCKLIDVLMNRILLARIVYGKEGRDWKWVEK